MATRIRLGTTRTVPEAWAGPGWPTGPQGDILRAAPLTTTFCHWPHGIAFDDTVEPIGEGKMCQSASSPAPMEWWSERVAAEVTISGLISFSFKTTVSLGWVGKLRARLYKITAGGSAIRTLLVTATSAEFSTSVTQLACSATPAAAVTAVRGERFILSITAVEHNATGTVRAQVNSGGDSVTSWFDFTETITFEDNSQKLFLRRDATIGIDDFLDLSTTRGSLAATTGVVATEAAATEVQFTRAVPETFNAVDISAAAVADTANATTYASGSFTPVANRLYLLAVVHSDAAPETTVPTVATTTGLTFVEVATIVFDTIASNLHRLTLFRAMKASGLSAGTYTVTLADAGTGCCTRLTEVANVVTTGADGADAVINISTNNANAGANPSVTLAAFNDVDNGTYACFASDIATAPTAGSGFTGLGHSTIGTPTKGVFAEWQAANDTGANCTLASSDWAGIAVELVQQAAGSPILLEWISLRFKQALYVNTVEQFMVSIFAHESDLAANCGLRVKVFRREPDGTETLCWTGTRVAELPTTVGANTYPPGLITAVLDEALAFQEDDRLVYRPYIHNVGTMAAGHTCTVTYDHNVLNNNGDCYLTLHGAWPFKAEGNPDRLHAIPGGMTTLGLGNDGA